MEKNLVSKTFMKCVVFYIIINITIINFIIFFINITIFIFGILIIYSINMSSLRKMTDCGTKNDIY